MKASYAATLVFALATVTAGQAMANESDNTNYANASVSVGKSRDQVRAELVQARRTGDIVANFETGASFKEQSPGNYPGAPVAQSLTREQVRTELVHAQHSGEVMASFELGPKFN
jgi:hypothetical protein